MTKTKSSSFEGKALVALSIIFVCVLGGAWMYALRVRQNVAANTLASRVDAGALIEVEHLRNLADAQIADSRSFFLLGARSIFDKQKKEKDSFLESLASFEKQYSLPQIPALVQRVRAIEDQNQDAFDQAMEFREKQTESKIVGQFYQSKTTPLRAQLNAALDEMAQWHKNQIEQTRASAQGAAREAEVQIPRGMAWFTGLLAILFASLIFLVTRMLFERRAQVKERDRLYEAAQKAVLSRDEVISAVAQDFEEPLNAISMMAERLARSSESPAINEGADFIKSSVITIEGIIEDILDQKNADMGMMTLRLDQLGIDSIMDEARLMLQPLAKQRDVTLQFDSVNPPVLAFFDHERVMRVLSLLVGNALKFSPAHGKVVVKVRSDQKFVNISVMDNGPGIPEKQLAEIFNHFWQARKTATQGAGIGLAVVKTIVEAHGGTVHVESQVGRGSTFTFSLPRRRPVGAQMKKGGPTVKYSTPLHTTAEIQNNQNI